MVYNVVVTSGWTRYNRTRNKSWQNMRKRRLHNKGVKGIDWQREEVVACRGWSKATLKSTKKLNCHPWWFVNGRRRRFRRWLGRSLTLGCRVVLAHSQSSPDDSGKDSDAVIERGVVSLLTRDRARQLAFPAWSEWAGYTRRDHPERCTRPEVRFFGTSTSHSVVACSNCEQTCDLAS